VLSVGRALRMTAALAVSAAAGWLFLVFAVTTDPNLRRALTMALDGEGRSFFFPPPDLAFHFMNMAMTALWMGTIFICVAPVIIVAVIGEAAQTRSFLWYGIATGTLAAAMPSILRASSGAEAPLGGELAGTELRWLTLFFLAGGLCGFVYWLLAGRACGSEARNG